jgi:hypothetical protein
MNKDIGLSFSIGSAFFTNSGKYSVNPVLVYDRNLWNLMGYQKKRL